MKRPLILAAAVLALGGLGAFGFTAVSPVSAQSAAVQVAAVQSATFAVENMTFLQSSAMQFAISVIGVLLFAGLTAYDTQNIKNTYLQLANSDSEFLGKAAIMGALQLYLDFINLFMFLLQFLGDRR